MTPQQYRRLNWVLVAGLLVLLASPRVFSVTPDGARLLLPGGRAVPELCLTKRATGRECGSCHLGRAVVLAAQGDVARSITHHRGGVVLVGWTAVQALVRLLCALAFTRLARHWLVDVSLTLGTLLSATLATIAMGG